MTTRLQRLVAAVPAALSVAALSTPVLGAFGYTLAAFSLAQFFSAVCHQDPARSFWILGAPVAVCTRCLGIYLGATAGAWLRASRPQILSALAVVVALSLADYAAEAAGLHGSWPWVRFALGTLLGTGLGALVAASIRETHRSAERLVQEAR